ncbi:MAG: hypothetical protein A2X94_17665 [Bdellovibrionales bacterium GWB1_55_8]|nr:MAG: hypothetical protein A2X94_17665 [Bdellovibrionales bacterium GWB1_55_8]
MLRRVIFLFRAASIFVFALGLVVPVWAGQAPSLVAQSVAISRNTLEAPAVDLLQENGTPIDRDSLVPKMKRGEDISLLQPALSDVWDPSVRVPKSPYPEPAQDGAIHLKFDSIFQSPMGLMRVRVTTDDENDTAFRLALTWNLHSGLMNAELLRKLGYTIDPPQHYSKGVIRFPDVASRDAFITEISRKTNAEPERWLIKVPAPNDLVLEIRDFVLEPARISTFPYYWGTIARTALQGRRALRALLIPLALTYVPDSINLWTWELGKVISESVILYHPLAGSFEETAYEDARWIARKIGALTEEDLREIVRAGAYPKSIEPLILEKLKSRRNQMLGLLKLPGTRLPVRSDVSYRDPETGENLVQNGKLLRKNFDGYGFDFIGADPENPLRRDELFRFFTLDGIGILMNSALGELNDRILSKDMIENAGKIGSWSTASGFTGDLKIQAARKVVSGTYYGSESQVQLVDRVSIGLALGYFYGGKYLDASPPISVGIKPNVGITRTYLHVKPVASMKQALKTPWKELAVIPKMRALGKLLDAKGAEESRAGLTAFFDSFLPGENFAIVDSLNLGLSAKATAPLGGVTGGVGLSGGVDGLVMRRTMIQRLQDGRFQISLQNVKKADFEVSLSFDMILQVIAAQSSPSWAEAKARIFVVDPTALTLSDVPADTPEALKLMQAFVPILRKNDTTALEKNYVPFKLKHQLHGREHTAKVLPWKWVDYHEEHRLRVLPQQDRVPSDRDPEDFARTLLSIRDVTLRGVDFLGFLISSFGSGVAELFPEADIEISPNGSDSANPANSFLGKSHSWETRTEAEITAGREARSILEHQETYEGWRLSKKKLFKIIDQLEKKVGRVLRDTRLIRRAEFESTEKLLMYSITAKLLLTEKGIEPLRVAAKGAGSLELFSAWLRKEGRSPGKRKWTKAVYKQLLRIPEAVQNEPRTRAIHKLASILFGRLELGEVIQLVGEQNAYFQIRVSGFRTKDENGDSQYLSDSIGVFDKDVGAGAFAEFAAETGISQYEISGSYLGGGL